MRSGLFLCAPREHVGRFREVAVSHIFASLSNRVSNEPRSTTAEPPPVRSHLWSDPIGFAMAPRSSRSSSQCCSLTARPGYLLASAFSARVISRRSTNAESSLPETHCLDRTPISRRGIHGKCWARRSGQTSRTFRSFPRGSRYSLSLIRGTSTSSASTSPQCWPPRSLISTCAVSGSAGWVPVSPAGRLSQQGSLHRACTWVIFHCSRLIPPCRCCYGLLNGGWLHTLFEASE
jgi:hypothetical protein